jgi:hypothetical protein
MMIMMMYHLKVVVAWVVTQNRFVRRNMLPFSRPKMKAVCSSETSVSAIKTTRWHNPEKSYSSETPKAYLVKFFEPRNM